jgi:hypothetical protein
MLARTRREFLAEVGRGTLVAAVGFGTAVELGLATAESAEGSDRRLRFGNREPLVELMQTHDGEKLLPLLVERLKQGTPLGELVAAAALANARTFGGQDYVGFHTMMALAPSYAMAQRLSGPQQALPVLKVLYRNSVRIAEHGGPDSERLEQIGDDAKLAMSASGQELLAAVHKQDFDHAEQVFAAIAAGREPDAALEELLIAVHDQTEVHRIVMPYRAFDLLDIVGMEHAHTLLRQSVRYCVQQDHLRDKAAGGRDLLPKLLEQHKLLAGAPHEARRADEAWLTSFAETLFRSTPADAAAAAAAALADGFSPADVGLAISLAANQLVLRDVGRQGAQARPPEKPEGSIHGDSIGVHASDSANAWRHLAQVGSYRNRASCAILGAHQVADDRVRRGGDFLRWQPYPTDEHLSKLKTRSRDELLSAAEAAIRDNDQAGAAAAVHQCLAAGESSDEVFGLLLKYSISEDGALHAEKYFQTVAEDYADLPAGLRSRKLVSLARVTASGYGYAAPGVANATRLLS